MQPELQFCFFDPFVRKALEVPVGFDMCKNELYIRSALFLFLFFRFRSGDFPELGVYVVPGFGFFYCPIALRFIASSLQRTTIAVQVLVLLLLEAILLIGCPIGQMYRSFSSS